MVVITRLPVEMLAISANLVSTYPLRRYIIKVGSYDTHQTPTCKEGAAFFPQPYRVESQCGHPNQNVASCQQMYVNNPPWPGSFFA